VAYLDTNVLLSHYFAEDPNHPYAAQLVENLRRRGEEMLVSLLTLVELYAYVSRRIGALKLPPHYARLGQKEKVAAVVIHVLKHAGAQPVDNTPADLLQKAMQLAHALKLKTLDLLHIAYALHLAEKGLIHTFATLDKEIAERRDVVERLGLRLLTPWTS
jgi:Predicted nucleic acid-binding protein, contains PIN domain